MSDVLKLFLQSLPFVLILFLFFICIRIIYLRTFHKAADLQHEMILAIFGCWIALMISLTMLSEIHITQQGLRIDTSDLAGINFKLFRVFKDIRIIVFENGYWPYLWINLIGNLLLFIPFGFLLPILFRSCSFAKVLLYSFLFSNMIEIIQMILPRGTDIDDVWLNCLGGIIGWIIFRLSSRIKNTN